MAEKKEKTKKIKYKATNPKEFSEIDEDRTFSPTPFNTGGPVRLMKMKHGY